MRRQRPASTRCMLSLHNLCDPLSANGQRLAAQGYFALAAFAVAFRAAM